MKVCTKCGQYLPLSSFGGRGGRKQYWCKGCKNAYQRAYEALQRSKRGELLEFQWPPRGKV